ncbi:MAG: HEPN domain-containing protein [Sedimentisphaerales bacterium]|nr:HEPN domain-containing protein [Sedimentisphaerales bacterium]
MRKDAQRHLESAETFLKESEHLFSGGFHNGTVGRAYYAMFHAATAVLLARDIERTSHHAIISAFGESITKPSLLNNKFPNIDITQNSFTTEDSSETSVAADKNTDF